MLNNGEPRPKLYVPIGDFIRNMKKDYQHKIYGTVKYFILTVEVSFLVRVILYLSPEAKKVVRYRYF